MTYVNKTSQTSANKMPVTKVKMTSVTQVNMTSVTNINKTSVTNINTTSVTKVNMTSVTNINKTPVTNVNIYNKKNLPFTGRYDSSELDVARLVALKPVVLLFVVFVRPVVLIPGIVVDILVVFDKFGTVFFIICALVLIADVELGIVVVNKFVLAVITKVVSADFVVELSDVVILCFLVLSVLAFFVVIVFAFKDGDCVDGTGDFCFCVVILLIVLLIIGDVAIVGLGGVDSVVTDFVSVEFVLDVIVVVVGNSSFGDTVAVVVIVVASATLSVNNNIINTSKSFFDMPVMRFFI